MKVNKHLKKMILFLGVAGTLILGTLFIIWYFADEYYATRIMSIQKTDDWAHWKERLTNEETDKVSTTYPNIAIEQKAGILLKTDSSGNLLLKHRYGSEIFLYDVQSKSLRQVLDEEWLRATTDITYCWEQFNSETNQEIEFDSWKSYATKYRGAVLETYGKYTIFALKSPTHSKVAILSAYGPLKRPGIAWLGFGMGGSDPIVYGRRYLQIIRLNSGEYTQPPVRLAFTDTVKRPNSLCWSNDEKYIIAYKPYENFSVIETNADGK
jgi:hypothetical protein